MRPTRLVRYAPHMEPMTWLDLVKSVAVAMWPLWAVLAALCVVFLASKLGFMAPDEYEEPPCGCERGLCCGSCRGCCLEDRLERERKYHGDDSWGR